MMWFWLLWFWLLCLITLLWVVSKATIAQKDEALRTIAEENAHDPALVRFATAALSPDASG